MIIDMGKDMYKEVLLLEEITKPFTETTQTSTTNVVELDSKTVKEAIELLRNEVNEAFRIDRRLLYGYNHVKYNHVPFIGIHST